MLRLNEVNDEINIAALSLKMKTLEICFYLENIEFIAARYQRTREANG